MSVKFLSKLPAVFKYLLEIDRPIPDDTCLQRLLDFVTLYVTEENLNKSGIISFLQTVTNKTDQIEPSVLSFTLLLCGKLSQLDSIYSQCHSVVTQLLQQVVPCIKDSSIGTAYFTCVSGILSHDASRLSHQDIIKLAFDGMKTGSSIFLQSAACDVIKVLLTSLESVSTHRQIVDRVMVEMEEQKTSSKNSKYLNCLLLLINELGDLDKLVRNILDQKKTFQGDLDPKSLDQKNILIILRLCFKLSLTQHISNLDINLEIVNKFIQLLNEDNKIIFIKEMWTDILLYCQIDLVRAHKISCSLYLLCLDIKTAVEIPLDLIYGRTTEINISKITKPMLPTLILQYLHCEPHAEETEQVDLIIKLLQMIQDKETDNTTPYKHYLLNNTQLLTKILPVLHHNLGKSIWKLKADYLRQLFDILVEICSEVQTDVQIFRHCMDCVVHIIKLTPDCVDIGLSQLVKLLEMKLCDMKWETRDTALEIINQLLIHCKDTDNNTMLLSLCKMAWLCCIDSNSYVRASVLTILSSTVENQSLFTEFLSQKDLKVEEVIEKLIKILDEDTEAFPRRSAVKTLTTLHQYCSSSRHEHLLSDIQTAMLKTLTGDFDWEVKILVLNFWKTCFLTELENEIAKQIRIENNRPAYLEGLPNPQNGRNSNFIDKINCAFCEALFLGFNDYEQSVNEKASKLIHTFLTLLDNQSESKGVPNQDTKEWIIKLKSLDLANYLEITDEYSRNPVSLLEDILSSSGEHTDDNFVDCY